MLRIRRAGILFQAFSLYGRPPEFLLSTLEQTFYDLIIGGHKEAILEEVNIERFGLIQKAVIADGGRVAVEPLSQITRRRPEATMEPFSFVSTLQLAIAAGPKEREVVLAFHMEAPDGSLITLNQVKPSAFPDWYRRWVNTRLGGLPAGVIDEDVPISPILLNLQPGQPGMVLRPTELRVHQEGDYIVRVVVDGVRFGEARFNVKYVQRREQR